MIRESNRVLITGGGGYLGSLLVPHLLEKNWNVRVLDTFWYGDHLLPHPRLEKIVDDLRFVHMERLLQGVTHVIHLACLSNDPSADLNPKLSRDINLIASAKFIDACRHSSLRRFIFASSSSVYGIKAEEKVTEDLPLEPLTPYASYKADIEAVLAERSKGFFDSVSLRPATLCGPSPRLRLDLVGNMLAAQAYYQRELSVHGGLQSRPQLDIRDMVAAYELCLQDPKDFHGSRYNVGESNHQVAIIAALAAELCPHPVTIKTINILDNRSYRISSEKFAAERGFYPKYSFQDGLRKLFAFFESRQDLDWRGSAFHNVSRMKELGV